MILPGDVLVDEEGDSAIVLVVETTDPSTRNCSCGCCTEEVEAKTTIWVADTEPVEVLTAGGGTTKVVGLVEWWGDLERRLL